MNTILKNTNNNTTSKWLDDRGIQFNKQQEMDFAYTNIDKLIRLSLGENAHFSNAFYDGNYSISLEEAQRRKCAFICEKAGIVKGSKVLDLGCGWGGFLKYLKEAGAVGTGITLSSGQVAACIRNGLNAHLKDMRYVTVNDFGEFDAVTAIGSIDHISSLEDYLNGKQDQVYDKFFHHIAGLLPQGGRFFMQSMVFGKNCIPYEAFDINAPKDSFAFICALAAKRYPNSWLPYGAEHIIRVAAPYFKVVTYNSGRLDYIETTRQWQKRFLKFNLEKYWWFLSLVPKYFRNKEFRYQMDVIRKLPTRVCFEREIMDHARIVFEKI